jgi:hypothetical protein
MADTKISALAAAAAAAATNELAINEAGTSKKITVAQLQDFQGIIKRRLNSDHVNLTTTPTEVAGGLECTGLVAGTYVFQYNLIHRSLLASTGTRINCNFTGTNTFFLYWTRFYGLIATAADANQDQDSVLAAGQVMQGWASRAGFTTGARGVTLSNDTADANVMTIVEGTLLATGTGDLELWFGAEVAASATLKIGSSLVVTRTA